MVDKIDFKWNTTPDFLSLTPLNVFSKENCQNAKASDITNYHCLARSVYMCDSVQEPTYIHITADDYYKLYINGEYVTQGPAPSYNTMRFFNTIDIAPYLNHGKNTIAVHIYYQGLINRVWQSGDNRFGVSAVINGQNLCFKYCVTNAFSGTTVGYDTAFLENFDSSLFNENWFLQDFDDSAWQDMIVVPHDYTFCQQPTAQLQVYDVTPSVISTTSNGNLISTVYDFNSEIVACLNIKACGNFGDKITILCGEELNNDGTVKYNMRANCTYNEVWTLANGNCSYNNYDYKAFRYVQIIHFASTKILSVTARAQHYPFDDNMCTISSNNEKLNAIFNLCKNTVKWATQHSFIDCPSREKGQYLGDVFVIANSHLILTKDNSMLRKAIDDFAQTNKICKGLMAVSSSSLMQEIADYSLLFGSLLLLDYKYSADKDFLLKYYTIAKDVVSYFTKYQNGSGLLSLVDDKWNLVDWPESCRDNYDFSLTRPITDSTPHCVLNSYFLGAVKTLNTIEEILALPLSFDFSSLYNSYLAEFFNGSLFTDTCLSSHTSLHSNALALYFNLVPKHKISNVANFIISKGFSCGTFFSFFVLKALTQNGYYQQAYDLIVNSSNHGWLNMLSQGATTCFEAWGVEQKHNTSLCHPWSTSPIIIIAEDLLNADIKSLNLKLYSYGENYALSNNNTIAHSN